jgi:hypothetical protein
MWKTNADERLERWKNLRRDIGNINFDQALIDVIDAWNQAPFQPYYLEWDQPESWPDPWTLITENYYCDLAKALGLLYTIYLSPHGEQHQFELRIFQGPNKEFFNLVFIDDGKYVLNLEPGMVVNKKSIPKDLQQVAEYRGEHLRLEHF